MFLLGSFSAKPVVFPGRKAPPCLPCFLRHRPFPSRGGDAGGGAQTLGTGRTGAPLASGRPQPHGGRRTGPGAPPLKDQGVCGLGGPVTGETWGLGGIGGGGGVFAANSRPTKGDFFWISGSPQK